MVALTFPDGARREYPQGTTGLDIAKGISPSLAKRTVAMALDGTVADLAGKRAERVPDRRPSPVLVGRAFNLVGRGRRAPLETFGELRGARQGWRAVAHCLRGCEGKGPASQRCVQEAAAGQTGRCHRVRV